MKNLFSKVKNLFSKIKIFSSKNEKLFFSKMKNFFFQKMKNFLMWNIPSLLHQLARKMTNRSCFTDGLSVPAFLLVGDGHFDDVEDSEAPAVKLAQSAKPSLHFLVKTAPDARLVIPDRRRQHLANEAWHSNTMIECAMVQKSLMAQHLMIHFPTSSGVSIWANNWAQRSMRKPSELCRASEWDSKRAKW